jgi:hypothetical protein
MAKRPFEGKRAGSTSGQTAGSTSGGQTAPADPTLDLGNRREIRATGLSRIGKKIRPQLNRFNRKIAALPARVAKRRREHYEWLVRYQIRGETWQQIAAHPSIDPADSRLR